ncbi:amino acid ABC transporter substrate-binding protein [Methanobrevibacter sp.]
MNRKIIYILTFVLAAFLMMSCVSAEGLLDFLNSTDSTGANNDTTFVVGFNSNFPPFGYEDDNGEFTGFDLDLAKEVCNRNNWTFVAQPIIDWNTKQLELDSGEIDCIWSEFTINGRENDYTWSEPYFNNTKIIIVKGDSNISSVSDLKGKTVEVQYGSSLLNTVKNNETLKDSIGRIIEVEGYDAALMDLQSNVCDAVICDIGLGHYKILENSGDDFKVLDDTISSEQYGIGFKKGNAELRNQVQKTLDEMFEDGTVDEIAQNYSDYKIPEGLIYPK